MIDPRNLPNRGNAMSMKEKQPEFVLVRVQDPIVLANGVGYARGDVVELPIGDAQSLIDAKRLVCRGIVGRPSMAGPDAEAYDAFVRTITAQERAKAVSYEHSSLDTIQQSALDRLNLNRDGSPKSIGKPDLRRQQAELEAALRKNKAALAEAERQ